MDAPEPVPPSLQRRRPGGGGLSLRLRIVAAFSALALITLGLGAFAIRSVEQSGGIVVDIFGRSLIATSYARSAAANFAALDAALERLRAGTEGEAPRLRAAELTETIFADLRIARDRATSDRVVRAARAAQEAVQAWMDAAAAEAPERARLAQLRE